MKLLCLVGLALCAFAHAGDLDVSQDDISTSVSGHIDIQELHLHKASLETGVSQDDQLLSYELTELERVQSRNIVADNIANQLESFRDVVINGNDDIPPLDPLVVDHLGPYQFTTTGARATANIRNFNLNGLRWYVVDHVTFNALRLALGVQMTVPHLTFSGSYDAQAFITLITHRAGGNFRIFINRLQVSVDIRFGTNIFGGGHLTLRELDVGIVIHDVNINIEGMTGSSLINGFINSWMQSATQNLLQNELENVSQKISEELFDVINDLLKDFTMEDLLS